MRNRNSLFEMRRLEALSNTIFGVAMTLLAYDFPKLRLAVAVPNWLDIWHAYASHLVALLLGFVVAGMFWFSHQRRLAYAPEGSRVAVLVNLLFLLSIILLPATTGLYGSYWESGDVIALYGLHLALIAMLNLVLWAMVVAPHGDWQVIWTPAFPALVFVAASVVALSVPDLTRYIWPLAFISPAVSSFVERRAR